jgi:hypothetical protein
MEFQMNSVSNTVAAKQINPKIINKFFDSSPNDESQMSPKRKGYIRFCWFFYFIKIPNIYKIEHLLKTCKTFSKFEILFDLKILKSQIFQKQKSSNLNKIENLILFKQTWKTKTIQIE